MKRALRFLGGLTILAAFGGGVWAYQQGLLPFALKEPPVKVPKGTEVPLILLESLDAGGSKVGHQVKLAVVEDVVIDDRIVILRGTEATAEVTESRGASLMGAISNRPARLAIRLEKLRLRDGRTIDLQTEDGKPIYTFTQANTVGRTDAARLDRLWEDPKSREALEKIAEGVRTGSADAALPAGVGELAGSLGLERTRDVAEGRAQTRSGGLTLDNAMRALQTGDMGAVTGVDAVTTALALGELANLANSVEDKVRGLFKGRTIRATVGTPVTVVTAESFTVERPLKVGETETPRP